MSYEVFVQYDPEHPDNRCAGAPSQVLKWVADAHHLEQQARNAFGAQVFSDKRRCPNAIQHIDRKA